MATNIGTLMIGVRGDVAALHADVQSMNVIVRRGFDQMGADMRRAEQAGRQFNEQMRNASMSLRGLVAEAAGLAGIGSAMATVFAVPRAGVKYAAEMETMRLGMAGTLASMGQIDGKAIDIGKAVEISAVITGKLQQKAMETSANMHELVGAYQAIIGPGLQAGASLEKMVDFVTAGTVAVKSMGLKSGQVVQELRDLVQGGIQPASSTLATAIGVGDKDIKEIKAKGGDLIGFLMDRMKGFSEASTLYAQTFTGKVSGMQEAFNILAAKGSEPIFDALKTGIDGVMNAMGTTKEIIVKNGDEVKKSMTWTVDPAVVAQIRDVSQNVVDLSKSAISVGQALWEWREPIGYIAAAMVTIKGMRFAGAVGDGVGQKFQELRSYFAAEKDAAKAVVGAASGDVERAKAIQLRAAAQELASQASVKDALAASEVAAANMAAAQSEVARQSALVRSLELQLAIAAANFDVAKGTAAEAMAQQELTAAQARYAAANEALIAGKAQLLELTQAETAAQTRLAVARDAALGATNANVAATSRLSLATNGLVAAKAREAAAMGIAAMAGRAASGVLAALGGPIGVATLAIFGMVMAWDHLADSTVHAADASENSANRIRAALKSSNFAAAESERARLDALYAQQTAESNKVNGLLENMRKRGEDKTMPGLYAQYLGSRDQWANILSDTRAGLAKVTTEINEAKQAQASAALKNVEKAFDPRDYKAGGAKKYQQFDLSSVKPRFDKNYKNYMEGEGLTTTKEEDRAKKLEKENEQFKLAVKDYKVGSKEYQDALKAHKDRVAFINKEDKGGGKGARSLPVDIRALADEEARLQQVRAQIEQVRKSGLAKPDMTDGEKAAEKYRQEAAAARELGKASLAAAKDKLAARAVVRGEAERELKELERANQLRLEFTQADEKRAADLKIANEEAENEYKWLALSNEERAAAQAAWGVEKKARQEILDLQKQQREATTAELKDQLASRIEVVRSQAEEDKITAAARARRQSSLQEWGQIGSDIERALTDSIMRGFEGGKSGIESFKQALSNAFKSYTVKLLVQPVMSEVNSLGAQMIGGQGVGGVGSAGGMSLDSMLGLGKLAGQAGDGLNWLGDALGMDSLKSLGSSLNGLMGSAGTAAAALDGVGSFLGSGMAYGANSALSGFSTGLEGASAGLAGWSAGLQGSAGSFAGLNNTVTSLTQNSAAFNSVANASANSVATGAGGASTAGSSLSTYAGYAASAYSLYNSLKTGQGWGSTIGSMAYFIPGIGPIAGLAGSLVGGLADSAFGHKGGPKTGGNANAVFDASGNVLARNMFGGYTPDQLDSSFTDQLKTLQGNYATLTKALGGTVQSLTMNLGGDQDPQGSAGNRVSAQVALGSVGVGMGSGDAERALWDKALYSSVSKSVSGDFNAAVKLETTRMLVAALKASDLPEEVSKFLGEIDLPNATQDQLDTLVSKAQALAALGKVFEQFASVLPALAGGSLTAKERLVSLSGGLDALASGLASYRDAYFSDAEKQASAREQIRETLADVGVALPATRAEFRKLLEALDPMSEAGAAATVAMLSVAEEFAELAPSVASLEKLASAFSNLGQVFPGIAGASERARLAIADLGGGIDALASNIDGYRANFYTQVERDRATYRQVSAALAGVGLAMPGTRDAFRALVEGLDQSTVQGQKAFAVMMGVQDAFASITPAAESAKTALADLAKSLQSEFSAAADKARATLEALKQASGGRLEVEQWLAKSQGKGAEWISSRQSVLWAAFGEASSPEQQLELLQELKGLTYDKYQVEIDAVKELTNNAGRLKDAAKSIRDYVLGLKVGELSPATMGERLTESASQFYVTLAKAQAGDQSAIGDITGKASAYLDLGKQYYGSSAPYSGSDGIFSRVVGALDGLGVGLDSMSSGQDLAAAQAQAQLKYSAQAISEMQRLRDGFLSVEGALQAQLLRQTVDAAAILGKMRDEDILRALSGLPAELAALIKGAWIGLGRPSAGADVNGASSVVSVSNGADAAVDAGSIVDGWYRTDLGRSPDAEGLAVWTRVVSSGDPSAHEKFMIGARIERDISAAYVDILGRQGDPAGIRAYQDAMLRDGWTLEQVRASLRNSAEGVARLSLPQFAVGVNELPADMLALVHAGERIMPAADNADLMMRLDEPSSLAASLGDVSSLLTALLEKVDLVVMTLQQHGVMTVSATQAGAEAVVDELHSRVKEIEWLRSSLPSMA